MTKLIGEVHVISDATGSTAKRLAEAILAQFDYSCAIHTHAAIRDEATLRSAFAYIRPGDLVLTTIIEDRLRQLIIEQSDRIGWSLIDLMGAPLGIVEQWLGRAYSRVPGLQYRGESAKHEAIDFAFRHDDGLGLNSVNKAQVVLVGAARCGKTPICVHLATRGWYAANLPLIHGVDVSEQLVDVKPAHVVYIEIDPDALLRRREMQMDLLGSKTRTQYTDLAAIQEDNAISRTMAKAHGWTILNCTNLAIEEASAWIENNILQKDPS